MELLYIIFGLVALVWGAVLVLRGGLLAGALLVLLVGSCFGHPFFVASLGGIPVTLDRILLAGLLGLYVVFRKLGWAEAKPLRKCDYVLFAFTAVLIASTFIGDWRAENMQAVSQLIVMYLMPVTLYWIVRQTRVEERGVRWTFAALGVFGGWLALTAVAEVTGAYWAVFPKYVASVDGYDEFFGRARGPFLNPITNGFFLAAGLFAALTAWPRLGRGGQLALLAAAPLYVLGVYCTLTRSVWLGAALGLLAITTLAAPGRWRVPVVVGALLLGLTTLGLKWEDLSAFRRDKHVSAYEMSQSAELRPMLAVVAWNMFLDRPLLGHGFSQYDREKLPYLSDRSSGLPLEVVRPYTQHNAFLALLAETGLLGAGLFVLLLTLWSKDAWDLWRSRRLPLWARQAGLLFLAAAIFFVANALFHNVGLSPMSHMLLFFLAGLAGALAARRPAPKGDLCGTN